MPAGLTLIRWTLGSAVAAGLAGAVLTQKLGLGLGLAVIGLLALWLAVACWGDSLTRGHWPHRCC
jgi:hypothetical protein